MKACRAGHLCTVKFLIQHKANVNKQTTNNDHTPLSLAAAGGHIAVVELLLANNANPFHKLKVIIYFEFYFYKILVCFYSSNHYFMRGNFKWILQKNNS